MFMLPGFFLGVNIVNPRIDVNLILDLFTAFIALGLASSANYIINEFNDRKFDVFHPIKSKRVAVNTEFSIMAISSAWLALATASFGISILFLNLPIVLVLLLLLIFGLAYNLRPIRTKDIPVLDVIWEGLNGPIRVYIGWLVVSSNTVPPLSFLMAFYGVSVFLMSAKRISEYKLFRLLNYMDNLLRYRKSFSFYNEERLLIQSFVSALMAVFFFTIFSIKWNLNLIVFIPLATIFLAFYLGRVLNQPLNMTETPHSYFGSKGKTIFFLILLFAMATFFIDRNEFLLQLLYSYQLNLEKIVGL